MTTTLTLPSLDRAELAERLLDEMLAVHEAFSHSYARGDHANANRLRGHVDRLKAEAIAAMSGGEIKYRRR